MKTTSVSQRLLAILMAVLMLCSAVPAATLFSAGAATATASTSAKQLSKAKVTVASVVKYTGKAKKPVVQVKYGKKTLTEGVHYTVKYVNNVNVGVAKVKITAKKNSGYTGTKTVKFKILPAKVSGLKATKCAQTYIKLAWNEVKGATGYVLYSYDAATGSYTKLKAVKKTSAIATRLNAGTTYRFAVRAYTRVNDKNYYGNYSKLRKAATAAASVPATQAEQPTTKPVEQPTTKPAEQPTTQPAEQPTTQPSEQPTTQPSVPLSADPVIGLKAEKSEGAVRLTWNAAAGATGYEICTYDKAKANPYTVLLTASSNNATVDRDKISYQVPMSFAVRALQTANGTTTYSAYSEPVTVTVYYVDYYAAAIKKGEYTVKMRIEGMDDLGMSDMTLAAKNGNVNMKTTIKDDTMGSIDTEMRYIKAKDKLYVSAMGLWFDGNSILGEDDDITSQMNVLSALELDDLDNVQLSTERIGDTMYTVETVTGKSSVTKFYFSGGELKRIAVESGGASSAMQILSFSNSASDSFFQEPVGAISV